jgi:hypothetical protein
LTSRQVNWTTKLQDYNFVIWHVEGTSNARADALSRPEGMERPERKTATLLPDKLFIRIMTRKEVPEEEELSKEEKGKMIKNYHDSPTARHPGVKKTLDLLRRRGHKWKGIRQDVKNYVGGCLVCQKVKAKVGPSTDQLQPLPIASGPWEIISGILSDPYQKVERTMPSSQW